MRPLLICLCLLAGMSAGEAAFAQTVTYDPSTRYLTIPSIQVGDATYRNVVVRVDSIVVISVGGGSSYVLRPNFKWDASYGAIDGAFPDVNAYTFNTYNFQLDSNVSEVSMDQICGNGVARVAVELFPPAGTTVVSGIGTYNSSTPISNSGVTACIPFGRGVRASAGDFYASNWTGSGSIEPVTYTFGLSPISPPIPAGYWLFKIGGVLKGQFDVAVQSPLTATNGVKGFVPSFKVNTDSTGKIASVDVRWYAWNGTSYEAVTDIGALRNLVDSGDVEFDNGTGTFESVHFDPSIDTHVIPTANTWYYGARGPANQQAQMIGVFYHSGGLGYYFLAFRR